MHRFKNHLLRIDKIYAFIAKDKDGNEGLPAFLGPLGPMPMVAADLKMVEMIRKEAVKLAVASGQKITLVEFSVRTELEVIHTLN